MPTLTWHDRAFDELTTLELYAIISLRERVFVVEQECAYLDADGRDPTCRHLFALRTDDGELVAYARLVPAGMRFASRSIGRVVIDPSARGEGLGRELMTRAISACGTGVSIAIAAQAHLETFYESLGFHRTGDVYDEDGIAHVDMLRAP